MRALYYRRRVVLLFVALIPINNCDAQGYPDQPIRFVVPFAPGSGTDIIARLVSQKLAEIWRHPIIVDNRSGAAGNIGAELVAKSAPDGYTILLGNIATFGTNPSLYKNLPYDAIRDFAPITLLSSDSPVLVVHPSVPAKNLRELIAVAKARPGELTYGAAGIGSGSHLAVELLSSLAKITLVHVPYKGSGQFLSALVAGETSMGFTGMPAISPFIKGGRLRALAVGGNRRLAIAPEVPTVAEAGVPGFEVEFWYGVLAPAGTPPAIVAKLNAGFLSALREKNVREHLVNQGSQIYGTTPERFAAFIDAEIRKWNKVIKSAGISVN